MKPSPAPSTLNTSTWKVSPLIPSSRLGRDRPLERGGPGGAPLADQGCLRHAADVGERLARVGRAARDVELLLGADDHVEAVQDPLQLGGDGPRFDEAALARAVPREAPEIGPVVDVEDRLRAACAGEVDRLERRGLGARVRDVGAGGEHAAGLGDEVGIDVPGREPHVRAVLAVEDERELLLVADAQQHQRGQALGVGDDAPHVDAFGLQLLADEAAHVLVADARDHRRFHAEPRGAGRRVGGRAADVLVERAHVLQAAADLAAVEIDRRAPDGDEVQGPHHADSAETIFSAGSCPQLAPWSSR